MVRHFIKTRVDRYTAMQFTGSNAAALCAWAFKSEPPFLPRGCMLQQSEEGGPFTLVLDGMNLFGRSTMVAGDWLVSCEDGTMPPGASVRVFKEREFAAAGFEEVQLIDAGAA